MTMIQPLGLRWSIGTYQRRKEVPYAQPPLLQPTGQGHTVRGSHTRGGRMPMAVWNPWAQLS